MDSAAQRLTSTQVALSGICALVLCIGLARFAYTPLLPLMQAQAGLGDAAAGALAACNYAGYMTGALLAAWIDAPRWRHRLYSWGLPLALFSAAAMAVSQHWWWWALLRFAGGLSGAAAMLLGTGLVMNWLIAAGRRPELGVHFMGLGLGIALSALGVMLLSRLGLNWAAHWWGLSLLALPLLWPAWAWRPPVPATPVQVRAAASALPGRWMLLMSAMYFCAGWGFVISATFTVAIVERQPLLVGQGPWAWLLVGLAASPAVFLWDRVARRLGEIRALLLAFALQIGSVLLPALSGSLFAALAGALLYGATFIGIVSLTLALVGRRSPANPGKAMARLTLSYGLAQISAPALTGWMVQSSGSFRSALLLTALVLLFGMGLLAQLRSEHQA